MNVIRANQLLKLSLGGVIVMILAVMYFGDNKLAQLAQETAQLKAQVMVNEKQIQTYKQTEAKVESLQYVNELANKVLPADQEQSVIVAEVSEFAKRSRLEVDQINFIENNKTPASTNTKAKQAIPSGVKVVPINVQFKSGSQYDNVMSFLRLVEGNRRKMQVTSVALTPNPENRQELNQVTVALNLYAKQTETKKDK